MRKIHAAMTVMLLAAGGFVAAAPVPDAVIADGPRDMAHAARNAQLLVPSDGMGMNALFLLAAGPGPHPTMLLLHGLPGNEQNLDLAQAVRRAGWNVLTLHYRGSWGSPGIFSVDHALKDAAAAIAFLRAPEIAAKYGVDRDRLVMAGHSMGGFATARHAARDAGLAGVVLIDAWNAGATGEQIAQGGPPARAAFVADMNDFGNSLAGATPGSIATEIARHGKAWNLLAAAPGLARVPLLIVYAEHGLAAQNQALARAITEVAPGARLTVRNLPSDHSFADQRIALSAAVVSWLETLPGR
ncbi:alpha/beta hydrolase family protein [Sphingomonas oleivorans]|nr:alpha/beta fold hydrolase [Sphingomonas oleivorans]